MAKLRRNGSFTDDVAIVANVPASASAVTLRAAVNSPQGLIIQNHSTSAVLYVKFGTGASATSYTIALAAGASYVAPADAVFDGIITGVWATATGYALVTSY